MQMNRQEVWQEIENHIKQLKLMPHNHTETIHALRKAQNDVRDMEQIRCMVSMSFECSSGKG